MSRIREKKYAVMLTEGRRITDYMYDDVIQTKTTLYGIKYIQEDIYTIHAYSKEDGSILFKMELVENFSYTENVMLITKQKNLCYVYFDSCQKVKGPFSNYRMDNDDVIVSRETERIVGFMRVKNTLYGMYNKEGVEVLPIKYKKILPKPEGIIEVEYKDKVGLVNCEGKWIVKPIYDQFEFCNLVGKTLIKCWSDDECSGGLLDIEGNVVFPCVYSKIEIDEEKSLIYAWNKDELWGVYKPNGKMIFPEISPDLWIGEHTIEVHLNRQWFVYLPVQDLFLQKENCVFHKDYLKCFYDGKWHKLWYHDFK